MPSSLIWAARVVTEDKTSFYYTGRYGGFISTRRDMASFVFSKDEAEEIGEAMLNFIKYSVSGKLINSPEKEKKK